MANVYEAPPAIVRPEEWYRFRSGLFLCVSDGTVNLCLEGIGPNSTNRTTCFPPDEAEAFISFFRKIAAEAKKQAAAAAKVTPASATAPAPPPAPPLAPPPRPPPAPPLPAPAPAATGGSIFD